VIGAEASTLDVEGQVDDDDYRCLEAHQWRLFPSQLCLARTKLEQGLSLTVKTPIQQALKLLSALSSVAALT
jgi:hypothetical protein